MPQAIHDPAARAKSGTVTYFPAYEAWYRFNGHTWVLVCTM